MLSEERDHATCGPGHVALSHDSWRGDVEPLSKLSAKLKAGNKHVRGHGGCLRVVRKGLHDDASLLQSLSDGGFLRLCWTREPHSWWAVQEKRHDIRVCGEHKASTGWVLESFQCLRDVACLDKVAAVVVQFTSRCVCETDIQMTRLNDVHSERIRDCACAHQCRSKQQQRKRPHCSNKNKQSDRFPF